MGDPFPPPLWQASSRHSIAPTGCSRSASTDTARGAPSHGRQTYFRLSLFLCLVWKTTAAIYTGGGGREGHENDP
jgi:hypothetical protein